MAATPNLPKLLLDALKSAGLKATSKTNASKRMIRIAIDGTTLAHAYPTSKGGLRVYVKATKLPAKQLKTGWAETRDSGFSRTLVETSEIKHVVAAVQVAHDERA